MSMRFPNVRQIRRPVYVFSEDGSHCHVDKFRGLLRYSPLKPASTTNPSYLFIFRQDDRNFANQLYFSLRNGIASFPGSQQFVGVSIAKDRLDSLRLPAEIFKPQITSVAQPTMKIGREGVKLVRRRINKPDSAPRSLRLKPTVVYRSSTAPWP